MRDRKGPAVKAEEHLLKAYGMTLKEKEEIIRKNNGLCPICRTDRPDMWWTVDHCHRTGKIRDVICDKCNKMLGLAKDNPFTLLTAAHYVSNHAFNRESGIMVENVAKPDEERELEEDSE